MFNGDNVNQFFFALVIQLPTIFLMVLLSQLLLWKKIRRLLREELQKIVKKTPYSLTVTKKDSNIFRDKGVLNIREGTVDKESPFDQESLTLHLKKGSGKNIFVFARAMTGLLQDIKRNRENIPERVLTKIESDETFYKELVGIDKQAKEGEIPRDDMRKYLDHLMDLYEDLNK